MLIHTRCPIGDPNAPEDELYPANFDLNALTSREYSARQPYERLHYRMVRNRATGCVRADPILDTETLERLYRGSQVTEESVAVAAAETYVRYLHRMLDLLPDRRGVLEIGCGHGAFLERVATFGFSRVAGVEPSADALAKAGPAVRSQIVEGFLRPGMFPPETFSLVCGFQVLDHLVAPNDSLQACWDLLTPGGIMFWICHDIQSPLARILGKRCPMLHVQHIVLYDRRTIARLFRRNKFEVLRVFGVWNRYPLDYWLSLAPLPRAAKGVIRGVLNAMRLGSVAVLANLGNMGIIARKPVSEPVV